MTKAVGRGKGEVAMVISDNALGEVHGNGLALFSDVFAFSVIKQGCPAKYIKCIELPVDVNVYVIINNPFFQGDVDVKMKLKCISLFAKTSASLFSIFRASLLAENRAYYFPVIEVFFCFFSFYDKKRKEGI